MIERRLEWPLWKDDMQIHKAFHTFLKREIKNLHGNTMSCLKQVFTTVFIKAGLPSVLLMIVVNCKMAFSVN